MATGAQAAALEKKALAAESKSAGMRMLLEAGRSVSEVRQVFDAPYGFVYGVASRAGLIESTPRAAKPAKAAKAAARPAKAAPKATAKPARAAKAPAASVRSKAAERSAARRAAAKAAKA